MLIRLEPRPQSSAAMRYASPLIAAVLTLATGFVLFSLLGSDPLQVLHTFFVRPLSTAYGLGELAVKATPLSPSVPGDEIKGIEVYGATANSAGRFISDGSTDNFSRPNCAHWSNKVSCPAGQVAVGVRVGYHGGQSSKQYRNIALICKQSERTP